VHTALVPGLLTESFDLSVDGSTTLLESLLSKTDRQHNKLLHPEIIHVYD